jgi:hypothetical protein
MRPSAEQQLLENEGSRQQPVVKVSAIFEEMRQRYLQKLARKQQKHKQQQKAAVALHKGRPDPKAKPGKRGNLGVIHEELHVGGGGAAAARKDKLPSAPSAVSASATNGGRGAKQQQQPKAAAAGGGKGSTQDAPPLQQQQQQQHDSSGAGALRDAAGPGAGVNKQAQQRQQRPQSASASASAAPEVSKERHASQATPRQQQQQQQDASTPLTSVIPPSATPSLLLHSNSFYSDRFSLVQAEAAGSVSAGSQARPATAAVFG